MGKPSVFSGLPNNCEIVRTRGKISSAMSTSVDTKIKIVGHEWAIELFQRQEQADRIPHAILFSGSPSVGKSTLARFLAQYLNCQTEINKPVANVYPAARS